MCRCSARFDLSHAVGNLYGQPVYTWNGSSNIRWDDRESSSSSIIVSWQVDPSQADNVESGQSVSFYVGTLVVCDELEGFDTRYGNFIND